LSLLEAGRRHDLALALRPANLTAPAGPGGPGETTEEDGLTLLGTALYALVGQSLVTLGRASWRIRWMAPSELISDWVPVAELQPRVTAAVHRPRDVARLRLHLAEHGVDVQVPVVLRSAAPQTDPVIVIAVTHGDTRKKHHTRQTLRVAS